MALFLIILAIVLIVLLASGFVVFNMAYKPSKDRDVDYYHLPNNPQYEPYKAKSNKLTEELVAIPYEEVWIDSFDGLKLHGRYYHVQDGAPLQIEFHGYHGNAYRDFCGGNRIAREAGHNTLLIDERGHGKSEGKAITFGINERKDAKAWAEYASKRFGESQKIILAGVSMGAATVLMASQLDLPKNVVGIMADCPFSSPVDIILKVSREKGLPKAVVYPLMFVASIVFGKFNIGAASPYKAVQNTKLPILIIHGTADNYVPYDMSVKMKNANPDGVDFLSVEGAGHGLSYMLDTDAYENAVKSFFKKVLS